VTESQKRFSLVHQSGRSPDWWTDWDWYSYVHWYNCARSLYDSTAYNIRVYIHDSIA